ncbi:TetR/AcrR family transcriptional regulator [Duganella sp. LX20W]|uniref:TetR/AcrR family transcriptional regulator n=1 Tax=Rugamonas brunnea TaxID=2758569 RepID=A0A7W2EVJ1_9BURK|nr:TetR/AcrR family transcriptional regulator [Rugamonas brunnea]MBA5639379.1 TetR/AcrR family transcriptional regulator [Rugamonas brunnea]
MRKPASPRGAHSVLRAQGERTRLAIVGAARSLLLQNGSLKFTLREIAQRAGISISNLQYYFPTRLAVLRAVFEPVLGSYTRELRNAMEKGGAPGDMLGLLVAKVMRDAKDAESSALWCHFLSLVAIDPVASQMLDECYAGVTNELVGLIAALNPRLTLVETRATAMLLIALMEGVSMRAGVRRRNRADLRGIERRFLAAVNQLLFGSLY